MVSEPKGVCSVPFILLTSRGKQIMVSWSSPKLEASCTLLLSAKGNRFGEISSPPSLQTCIAWQPPLFSILSQANLEHTRTQENSLSPSPCVTDCFSVLFVKLRHNQRKERDKCRDSSEDLLKTSLNQTVAGAWLVSFTQSELLLDSTGTQCRNIFLPTDVAVTDIGPFPHVHTQQVVLVRPSQRNSSQST